MYLHLGEKTHILADEVIGVFDIENTTVVKNTRNYLTCAQKSGKVVNVSYDLPKSFVVTNEKNDCKVYISPVAPSTIYRRFKEKKI